MGYKAVIEDKGNQIEWIKDSKVESLQQITRDVSMQIKLIEGKIDGRAEV